MLAFVFFSLFCIATCLAIVLGAWGYKNFVRTKAVRDFDTYCKSQKNELVEHQDKISAQRKQYLEEIEKKKSDLKTAQRTARKEVAQQNLAKQHLETENARHRLELRDVESQIGNARRILDEFQKSNDGVFELTKLEKLIVEKRSELSTAIDLVGMEDIGIFDSTFEFDDPQSYRDTIKKNTQERRELVRQKKACICQGEWTVGGSRSEGKKMTDRSVRLMLRAFNGECDAAVARVSANNYQAQNRKIEKTIDALNKLGQVQQITITDEYLNNWLYELRLTYERCVVVKEQKEREREIKAQMREEARAEAEIKKTQEHAVKEELLKSNALEKARAELRELESHNIDKHTRENAKLSELVLKLENELQDAIDRKVKATARAQLTRSGHVYVLSNIGSFGQDCYKIGMTRRLVPDERVKELGDASVPFLFDVHAMIYSTDAPALEKELHNRFDHKRVNKVNTRKEFFRVGLDEIQEATADLHGLVTWVVEPEAEQYHQTLELERQNPSELQERTTAIR